MGLGLIVVPWSAVAEPAIETLSVVEVEAPVAADALEITRPALSLEEGKLGEQRGGTLGETLARQPGISNASFGSAVGLPVIRGQSGSRAPILQNGLGAQDVSSLSPDHASSVDPAPAKSVEVLRGPATLRYGSGVIGGVVNVRDGRIPEEIPERGIGGTLEYRHDTVSDRNEEVFSLDAGKSLFAAHVDGFLREWDDVSIGGKAILDDTERNTRGRIANSDGRSQGGAAGFSLVGEDGFAGAAVSRLENNYGIPLTGHEEGGPVRIDLQQTRYDLAGAWNAPLPGLASLRASLGHVDYQHSELEGGEVASTFFNEASEGRLELAHEPVGPLKGMVGMQARGGTLQVKGEEATLPKSDIQSQAGFWLEEARLDKWRLGWGLRGEQQNIHAEGRGEKSHTPLGAATSLSWEPAEGNALSLSWMRSQRAPQAQELLASGVHHATQSFELGDENLGEETSHILELAVRFDARWVRGEFNLFHNWAGDYIHAANTGQVFDHDTENIVAACPAGDECLPVLQSAQRDAVFRGYEASLSFPLLQSGDTLDLTLFSDYTRGQFRAGGDVPRMPPLRYGTRVDYGRGNWTAFATATRGEAQTHPGENETPTDGYVALDVGVEYRLKANDYGEARLFARGRNLLNENIRSSVSFLRNFAPAPGRGAELGVRVEF
jgi:iron complex outermembrane receptor protein